MYALSRTPKTTAWPAKERSRCSGIAYTIYLLHNFTSVFQIIMSFDAVNAIYLSFKITVQPRKWKTRPGALIVPITVRSFIAKLLDLAGF